MSVEAARALLHESERIMILTGAGISAESGVPTFRGEDGLWKSYRPEELATPQAFRKDPRLVWEWYAWRRELMGRCEPNSGHRALAALARDRSGTRIVTQNVDGLHTLAARAATDGGDGKDETGDPFPLELHGSLFRVRCTRCHWKEDHRGPIDASTEEALPTCPSCEALARPAVVWFGESLDGAVLEEAGRIAGEADVALVVGTSAVVHPAASLPRITVSEGGSIVEVNPEETPLTELARFSLQGTAGDILQRLV